MDKLIHDGVHGHRLNCLLYRLSSQKRMDISLQDCAELFLEEDIKNGE